MKKPGYVYVLGNMYMDDLFKIGMTTGCPHERAAALSGATGVPFPFDVLYCALVDDARGVERLAHIEFDDDRVSSQREFFQADLVLIVDFISQFAYAEWAGRQRIGEINDFRCGMAEAQGRDAVPVSLEVH